MIVLVKENNKIENKLSLFKRILNNLFGIEKKEVVNKEPDRYSVYYRDDGIDKVNEFSEFPTYYKNLTKLEGIWEINPDNRREIVEINSGEKKVLRNLTEKKEDYFLEKFNNIIWVKSDKELDLEIIYTPYLVSKVNKEILNLRALLHFVYYYQKIGKICSIWSIRIVEEIPGYTKQNEEEVFVELNPYYKELNRNTGEVIGISITKNLIDFLEGRTELNDKMKEIKYKIEHNELLQ